MAEVNAQFNNFDLQDADFKTRIINDESSPSNDLQILNFALKHGAKTISNWAGTREITLSGTLVSDTQTNRDVLIDSFKQAMNASEQPLIIDFAGSTRQYTATVQQPVNMSSDFYHITSIPYELRFLCSDPFGYAPTGTTIAYAGIAVATYNPNPDFTGSAPQIPTATFTVNSETDLTVIKVTNSTTTGDSVSVTPAAEFAAGDILIVNFETYKVFLNGVETDYTGIFPPVDPDINDLQFDFTSTAHNVDIDLDYTARYL